VAARSDGTPLPKSRVLVRPALAASLAFLDAAHDDALRARELTAWFTAHLVKPGIMAMPATVQEPGVGVVSLRDLPSGAWAPAFEGRLREIVRAARLRISLALQGLLATPPDDRFLSAAIFAGRVDRGAHWRLRLNGTERLSDIVLAVLAADVLAHREEYEATLCVCAICGRISFSRGAGARTRCANHVSAVPDPRTG
jgi:hypothetical protein